MNGFIILSCVFFAICCGLLAKGKNRNPMIWLGFGIIGGIISFIVIVLLPRLCLYCSSNFNKNSDGVHCGSCGKPETLSEAERLQLDSLTQALAEQGSRVKVDGVRITVTQHSGASLNFVGVQSLEDYVNK